MDELDSVRSAEKCNTAEMLSRDDGYGSLADKPGPVFVREDAPSPTGARSPEPCATPSASASVAGSSSGVKATASSGTGAL